MSNKDVGVSGKNLFLLIFVALIVSLSNNSAAGTLVCDDDTQEILRQKNLNRIVVGRDQNTSCRFYVLDFEAPSEGYMCAPSLPSELSNGYTILYRRMAGSTTTSQLEGDRVCEGAEDWYYIDQAGSGETTICSSSPVPEGFVVTQYPVSSSGECVERMNIARPSDSTTESAKCAFPYHNVPERFVITSIETSGACRGPGGGWGDLQVIRLPNPTGETEVCQGTTIPVGYAFSEATSGNNCGIYPGFTIGPLSTTNNYVCIASQTDIPTGHVITRVFQDRDSCPLGSTRAIIEVPSETQETHVCGWGANNYIAPPGFIVSRQELNGACDRGQTLNYGYVIKRPGSVDSMCALTPLPQGYAIVGVTRDDTCSVNSSVEHYQISEIDPENGAYAYCDDFSTPISDGLVKHRRINLPPCLDAWELVTPSDTPGTETTVCDMTYNQLPDDFIVVERGEYGNCGQNSETGFGYRITRPYADGRENASCNESPIGGNGLLPTGFVQVGSENYARCSSNSIDYWGITIRTPPSGAAIGVCAGSEIPENFIVLSHASAVGVCDQEIVLAEVGSKNSACADSPIPQNFVITEVVDLVSCNFDAGMILETPNSDRATVVCADSPIPPGYVRASYGSGFYSQCDGFGFVIVPDGTSTSSQIVPDIFVNSEPNVINPPPAPTVNCDATPVDAGIIGSANRNTEGCN